MTAQETETETRVIGLTLPIASRQWRGLCGIYCIWFGQHKYVGSSEDIGRRMGEHHESMREPSKLTGRMECAVVIAGRDAARAELIEECSFAELRSREKYWQKKLGAELITQNHRRSNGFSKSRKFHAGDRGAARKKFRPNRDHRPLMLHAAESRTVRELAESQGFSASSLLVRIVRQGIHLETESPVEGAK